MYNLILFQKHNMLTHFSAPLRIDIGGGVSDIPEFSKAVGTCVTNLAIDVFSDEAKQNRVGVEVEASLSDVHQLVYNGAVVNLFSEAKDHFTGVRLAFKTFLREFNEDQRTCYTLRIRDTLPYSTGLGGSSALFLSIFAALIDVTKKGEFVKSLDFLKRVHSFETSDLGIAGGFQDYIAAYMGGMNFIEFPTLDSIESISDRPLGLQLSIQLKKALNDLLVVVVVRDNTLGSDTVVRDEIEQLQSNPSTILPLMDTLALSNTELYDLLSVQDFSLEAIGNSMRKSWAAQKRLSSHFESRPLADLESSLDKHVYGLRGPGSGVNSLCILMKPEHKNDVLRLINEYSLSLITLFPEINTYGLRSMRQKGC